VAADVKPAKSCQCSMGWIGPWVGLGWVEFFQFLVSWVGSSTAKVVKMWKDYVSAFKARLNKICCTKQLL